jgi:ABC-type arginine transport system permease subunit
LGGLIVGWPNFLIYFGFTILLAIIYLIVLRKLEKEIDLAPLWLLAAMLTLFLGKFISETTGLYLLKI